MTNTAHRIVVVGASGAIGSQLLADAQASGHRTLGTSCRPRPGLATFDLRRGTLDELVPDLGPGDCVYLLAAYTNPDWVFRNPTESYAINVAATLRAMATTLARGARFAFVSSDQIFDGTRGGYREDDTPAPLTLYGRQKVKVERALQASDGDWALVRTGWTVGWRPADRCPIRNAYSALLGCNARMATDNVFNLTDVRDVTRVLLALADGPPRTTWHAVSAPPIARSELADAIMAASRHRARMRYQAATLDAIPFAEPRPVRSWLDNAKATAAGFSFAAPAATIARKVELLDSCQHVERLAS